MTKTIADDVTAPRVSGRTAGTRAASTRASTRRASTSAETNGPVRLNLALQGGGAHGAYTWGVLDRLLEEERIEVGDVCGASAGALNGAALVTGWLRGGRQGARDNLALLWRQVTEAGLPMIAMHAGLLKPGLGVWDDAMPLVSPYRSTCSRSNRSGTSSPEPPTST